MYPGKGKKRYTGLLVHYAICTVFIEQFNDISFFSFNPVTKVYPFTMEEIS